MQQLGWRKRLPFWYNLAVVAGSLGGTSFWEGKTADTSYPTNRPP